MDSATAKPAAALATAASIAATAVLIRTIASDLVPSPLQLYLSSTFSSLLARLSSDLTIIIDESDGLTLVNHMYKAAEAYLATKLTPSTRRIRVAKDDEDSDSFKITIDPGQEIVDTFNGINFRWRLTAKDRLPRHRQNVYGVNYLSCAVEARCFELTFSKRHKDYALKSYLPFVVARARSTKTLKLYANNESGLWDCVNLRHPATFDTMAMNGEMKKKLMEDLERFVKGKEYFKRVGRAWKRGYLLYGPPGTGKSSLVAAMANYLGFDVYDLDLTQVKDNSGLRSLLLGTTNRSILVIEDIDCSADFQTREKSTESSESKCDSVTLSGLLNFVDGLWSSCGDERIIVFTTNYKERLDPALLRPGRMDVHIHMSYCNAAGFRLLASNYLCLDCHELFPEIEELIEEVEITPAEVAGELMRTDEAEVALQGLTEVLRKRRGNR